MRISLISTSVSTSSTSDRYLSLGFWLVDETSNGTRDRCPIFTGTTGAEVKSLVSILLNALQILPRCLRVHCNPVYTHLNPLYPSIYIGIEAASTFSLLGP